MQFPFAVASLWLLLAVVSAVIGNHLRISVALVEICIGVIGGTIAEHYWGIEAMGGDTDWLRFLAASGAILLTFLAGAELEPSVIRSKLKEVSVIGIIGFLAPFLGCWAVARFALGWSGPASWLCGVALSTTSMAVVYAVMLDTGLNRTGFGKGILGACFVNDLATVIALGLIFAPFTWKTIVFVAVCVLMIFFLSRITHWFTKYYANRTAAIRAKWVLFVLFAFGSVALWSGSEAVLPAYIAGMVLAGSAARDNMWIRRMRTLTVGFLTPFYFLRAGAIVSVPALIAAPLVFVALLGGKVGSKIFGLYPVVAQFRQEKNERWFYTLMMSTGLTFGTISALYGYSHGIVDRDQYSFLVGVVIASAVIPTLIATLRFLPKHLISKTGMRTAVAHQEDMTDE
ncbi:cation:proton antiporter [candidate division KSB1 bacterium]|nr:MAG: cation:proton antiporter [candidate division KSB1 bacterium]